MKTVYIKIDGMTCDHCKEKIKNALSQINNIKEITFDKNIATIKYEKNINKNKIIKAITELGYITNEKWLTKNRKHLKKIMTTKEFSIILIIIIAILLILNVIFNFNIIPVIDTKMTFAMLFVTGLLTSIHCISMCGAIAIIASTSKNKKCYKPIFYNLGRLISYTIIGGIIGLLGSILTINQSFKGIIIIITSILMILMSLNMMGIIDLNIKIPKIFPKSQTKNAFFIGILNGLMPCGPLQAMQLYAFTTGSFIYGALSMFFFCLGTIPLMLFLGTIINFINRTKKIILSKISIVLILVLSIVMLNRGLLTLGFNFLNVFKPNYDNYLKSEIRNDYQYIEISLTYQGYKDIVIQKGIPVKLIINAKEGALTGCNNAIQIKAFNIDQNLTIGQNIIEFTPTETGNYVYTCWMAMIKNNIIVIDDIDYFKGDDINE